MVATDLYGITIGFALASTGFGLTRPGFTGGASLAATLKSYDHQGYLAQVMMTDTPALLDTIFSSAGAPLALDSEIRTFTVAGPVTTAVTSRS